MSSYKSYLKRELIETIISEYVGDNANIQCNKCNDRITYSIRFNDKLKRTALLLVYFNKDGTTTIMYGTGKNPEYSKKLANRIIEKATIHLIDVNSLYFKNITTENIDELKQRYSDCGYIVSVPNRVSNGIQYHVQSENGESLHFIWYSNSAILFQGRPSLLFNQTVEFLLDYFPSNDVVKELLGYYKISIPQEDFEHEFETRYSRLYHGINEKLRAIILPAIALRKIIPENLSDYSYIAYPVLRGLEGVLRSIFLQYGITIDNQHLFKDCFEFNHTHQKWVAGRLIIENIPDTNTHQRLVNLYTLFYNKRHSLFHVDSLTPIITSREDALSIVDETLDALNNNI